MPVFPFPSNGKAYPKYSRKETFYCAQLRLVSIPFKRESVSKVLICGALALPQRRFNSLQTGKRIQRLLSLARSICYIRRVSIPFKRESVSKGYTQDGNQGILNNVSIPFKRESVSQAGDTRYGEAYTQVSIPFKRESVSQVRELGGDPDETWKVSIPFKRESVSQGAQGSVNIANGFRFHSLQTGKRIASDSGNPDSSRKVRSFHSLQTGKRIARLTHVNSLSNSIMFPFPSNGKAYRKSEIRCE